jgi:two-component sensor histidine kinase
VRAVRTLDGVVVNSASDIIVAVNQAQDSGVLLGWLSVAAVLIALALGLPVRHEAAVIALALAAGIGNLVVRRLHPDLWAGSLLVFVAALILLAGAQARFDLLLFLVLPFIAVTHEGRRLAAWLAAAATTFAAAMAVAPAPLDEAEIALHALLLIAAVILAVALARDTRRTAEAAARAQAEAELEQALLAEAHHRIKNSLQTVADLLLLGKGEGAAAFDATAARIRSISAVHDLLAGERGGTVAAAELLRTVAGDAATVTSDDVRLHSKQAQQLAMIANELVANALRHGAPPVAVTLQRKGDQVTLQVTDAGTGIDGEPGLGLTLVRQLATQGLGGTFEPATATLRFNVDDDADPDRRGRPRHRHRPDRAPQGTWP